jgi:hypothetical protein
MYYILYTGIGVYKLFIIHTFPVRFRLIFQVMVFGYRLTGFAVHIFHARPSMPPRCTVRTFYSSHAADLGADFDRECI